MFPPGSKRRQLIYPNYSIVYEGSFTCPIKHCVFHLVPHSSSQMYLILILDRSAIHEVAVSFQSPETQVEIAMNNRPCKWIFILRLFIFTCEKIPRIPPELLKSMQRLWNDIGLQVSTL